MPSTPFIGVRISWLIVAKNSLFAATACSANSLASTNSCSASMRCWLECKLPISVATVIKKLSSFFVHKRVVLHCSAHIIPNTPLPAGIVTHSIDFISNGNK